MKIVTELKRFNNTMNRSKNPIYRTWVLMMHRCYNKNHIHYERYGGRGVVVCKEWRNFDAFASDMGGKPSGSHTLDRIDNNKGYNKKNCRWASKKEQANNRKGNVKITYDGKVYGVIELCRKFNIQPRSLFDVRKRGQAEVEKFIDSRKNGDFFMYEINGRKQDSVAWAKETGLSRQIFLKKFRRYGDDLVSICKPYVIRKYPIFNEHLTVTEIKAKYQITRETTRRILSKKDGIAKLESKIRKMGFVP